MQCCEPIPLSTNIAKEDGVALSFMVGFGTADELVVFECAGCGAVAAFDDLDLLEEVG